MRARIFTFMNLSTDIATRLDQAMHHEKWGAKPYSQYRLSKDSGVPQSTISRILKGNMEQGPELGTIRKLAIALKCNILWLHSGIGRMDDENNPDVVLLNRSGEPTILQLKPPVRQEEFPKVMTMPMTGPHFLRPEEWLLVSYYRRMDSENQGDLLGYAEGLPKVVNPPIASNEPK
jgi:transcriptional regulator with XRE-family HTH domain